MNYNHFAFIKKSVLVLSAVIFSCSESNLKLKTVNASDILRQVKTHNGDKSVLVNFWATTCAPCIEEIPWILELSDQYGEDLKVYFAFLLLMTLNLTRIAKKNYVDFCNFLKIYFHYSRFH